MDNKYFECIGILNKELMSRDFVASEYRFVYDCIYNYAYYRKAFHNATSAKDINAMQESLVYAKVELKDMISSFWFDDDVRKAIMYLAKHDLSVRDSF